MKSILIFMPSLAGGGAERTVVNLVKGLVKKEVRVTLVLGKERESETHSSKYLDLLPEQVNLEYLTVEATKPNVIRIIWQLRKIVIRLRPSIFFSTRLESNLVALISSLFLNVKLFIRESNFRSATITNSLYRKVVGCLYNRAHKVICLSHGVADDLVAKFGVKISRISVIYNPIDIEHILNSAGQLNDRKANPDRCIFLGRLSEQKNPADAIKAFSEFKSNSETATLRIVGVGPLERELKSLSKSLGIDDCISFEGFLSNPYEILNDSDFLIMTSNYEGFGHVIVESMICGCIPVVYDCKSGPSEILTDNLSGLLVPVGEYKALAAKLSDLSRDNAYFSKVYTEIIQRSNDFSLDKITLLYFNEFFGECNV